jgi:hypothetical protein
MPNPEQERLKISSENTNWKKWGPYLSERQWGTVREDYSPDGSAWEYVPHDHARSKAFRWGEEGIGGICDNLQYLCFAWSFWNGKDPIIKERIFGLTGHQGNHGEDPKEYYYYQDSTPTHSYMRMLYKYPHATYPYDQLVAENAKRSRKEPEFELIDTGVLDEGRYFDIVLEYAKAGIQDILIKATIHNNGPEAITLNVLPTLWFRNIWFTDPSLKAHCFEVTGTTVKTMHPRMPEFNLYCDGQPELLFCDNETNTQRLYDTTSPNKYYKDGINDFLVEGNLHAINPDKEGSKMAANYRLSIKSNSSETISLRLCDYNNHEPFHDFDSLFQLRKQETELFYEEVQVNVSDPDMRDVQRQAFAGLLWCKQFFYYTVQKWLDGDKGQPAPPEIRKEGRNKHWTHVECADIISMPDKWEYPWFAAWDLAFHSIPFARIDVDFAKEQLLLLLSERYLHPNGQIPAYEWQFGDVNPPVHAWAMLRVFHIDKKQRRDGGDIAFLEKAYHKLLMNFTWWVNRKDSEGNNIFEGGFLGLDNIGVFDRSRPMPTGGQLEQADGTAWMAMYSLNMLRIAIDLADQRPIYEDMAIKFLEHFLSIAHALNNVGENNIGMWDEEDNFFYDVLQLPEGKSFPLRIRSMVGIIPVFAVETIKESIFKKLPKFSERLHHVLEERPALCELVSHFNLQGTEGRRLLSLLRGHRMKKILQKVLDEEEFLSEFGVRALSKYHLAHPYKYITPEAVLVVPYTPGESESSLFGGNSNWRGPIWFPVNYLLIESLLKFHHYYGDEFKLEYPSHSGNYLTIKEVAYELGKRLIKIFTKDENGLRPLYNNHPKLQNDPAFNQHLLFHEYFHGETGAGLGSPHQTGWTALVADMIHKLYN